MIGTLIVFARAPVAGKVKTRLEQRLGGRAVALYEAFLEDTCAIGAGVDARRVLAVSGGATHPAITRIAQAHGYSVEKQCAGDLGERMDHALTSALAGGGPVCIIGSDAPTLPRALVEQAFAELRAHDLVLGPANDGGYWLVGARRPAPELFADMPWGTPVVLPRTLNRLRGTDHALLPFWYDVDDPASMGILVSHLDLLPPEIAPVTRRVLAGLGVV